MAAEEYLARDFKFSASTDGSSYTAVAGVNKWSWTEDPNEVDITDFDDAGWENSMNASMKEGIKLEGRRLMDATTGAMDPGQKILYTQARILGPKGYAYIKVEPRDAALTGSIIGKVRVKAGEVGGGNDDALSMSFELMFKGKPTLSGIFDPTA